MAIAVVPADAVCPHCGAPTTSDDGAFPASLLAALFRCVGRGLIQLARCADRWELHVDATPLGRTVFLICMGAEVV